MDYFAGRSPDSASSTQSELSKFMKTSNTKHSKSKEKTTVGCEYLQFPFKLSPTSLPSSSSMPMKHIKRSPPTSSKCIGSRTASTKKSYNQILPSSSSSTLLIHLDGIAAKITAPPSTSTNSPQKVSPSIGSSLSLVYSTSTSSSSSSKLSTDSISSQKSVKRKRAVASSADDQDSENGFEPPSAKRQQRVPILYQSDVDSVASSVYALSPLELQTNEDAETLSTSSECPEFNGVAEIPESPLKYNTNSKNNVSHHKKSFYVEHGALDDYDAEEESSDDEDEIISNTTSPSSCTDTSPYNLQYDETYCNGERTPAQGKSIGDHVKNPPQPPLDPKQTKSNTQYSCMTPAESDFLHQCPLPVLSWANAYDVWRLMFKKDEWATTLRRSDMLVQHPTLQSRMRAILLDWLIEVCEVYKLHRETYYLAMDFLDRYLSTQRNVQKTHLQLIGITCLFIAAKVEEIYPPKIGEFAYVTDGACKESDILRHELLVLEKLEWQISPVTVMGWLGVYMQLNVNNRSPTSLNCDSEKRQHKSVITSGVNDCFIYPQFSGMEFVKASQLLDLCTLDLGICNFPYSVTAASAMALIFDKETALRCSGLEWSKLSECVRWMIPFYEVISSESNFLQMTEQNEQVSSKFGLGHICPNIVTDGSHIIQSHTTTMDMYERALLIQAEYNIQIPSISHEASPAVMTKSPLGLLTPPTSSRKPADTVSADDHEICSDGKATNKTEFDLKIEEKSLQCRH